MTVLRQAASRHILITQIAKKKTLVAGFLQVTEHSEKTLALRKNDDSSGRKKKMCSPVHSENYSGGGLRIETKCLSHAVSRTKKLSNARKKNR